MGFGSDDISRVSRAGYWKFFIANLVAIIALIGVCFTAAMNGELAIAIIAFLLIAPVGIYFRVIMMRRCRDLGWPTSLPWITFGLGIVANFYSFGSIGDAKGAFAGLGLAWLVGMIDFVLMIVLGVVKGREPTDYSAVFGDGPALTQKRAKHAAAMPSTISAPPRGVADGDSDAMDDAIARALDNYRRTGSAVAEAPAASPLARKAAPAPRAAPPRAAGFGRKMV
ncbi:DUF805 domain-containing protein [Aurantiacibacter gangjinensis]|nr:DUF805 domain-containing protein [Aurantiacibacter gangjinensis]APE29267.1 hypothetical protein BMF35_b0012 [Aurantiacibacter gangjinensis]